MKLCLECKNPVKTQLDKTVFRCNDCKFTPEVRLKMALAKRGVSPKPKSAAGIEAIRQSKLGDKNPMWKGDSAGYKAIHDWIYRHKEKVIAASSAEGLDAK